MLYGLFGWRVAGLYIASGLTIAIIAGGIIGQLKLECHVEDSVWHAMWQAAQSGFEEHLTWTDRITRAWSGVKDIILTDYLFNWVM